MKESWPRDPDFFWGRRRQPHPRLDNSAKLKDSWSQAIQNPDGTYREEFKNWFGKSIITVDGNPGGEPAVLYHFWQRLWESQKTGKDAHLDISRTELGLHLGTANAASQRFWDTGAYVPSWNAPRTIPIVVKMESPLYLPDLGVFRPEREHVRGAILECIRADRMAKKMEPLPVDTLVPDTVSGMHQWLKSLGYDGIIYRNPKEEEFRQGEDRYKHFDSVIVFNPHKQLRSAISGKEIFDEKGRWLTTNSGSK